MYREPGFYDGFMRDDDPIDAIIAQVEQFAPDTATVVDGHGPGVRVDVQAELIAQAGEGCEWVVADAACAAPSGAGNSPTAGSSTTRSTAAAPPNRN